MRESQCLVKLALIISIMPSSASVERLFSKLGRSETKFRNRISKDTLSMLGKIKIYQINEFVCEA